MGCFIVVHARDRGCWFLEIVVVGYARTSLLARSFSCLAVVRFQSSWISCFTAGFFVLSL